MPQFSNSATYRINTKHVAVGLTIFVLGLSKKVLIADNLAEYATPIFNAARDGQILMLLEAWTGALAYTLQLYFDFSGYSDMAIGLSLMFNVRLPINFDSPYKATSIIDFWRRWHMTLSAFLRDYLYIPLGGNRKGSVHRYANLITTMLLGGLWHGAGWTFIVWGGLHGLYLMINHGWRELKERLDWHDGDRLSKVISGALTFLAVVVAWVFFRSDSLSTASSILSSMAGINGVSLPPSFEEKLTALLGEISHPYLVFKGLLPASSLNQLAALRIIAVGLALIWLFPNVRQMLGNYKPTWEDIAGKTTPAGKSNIKCFSLLVWQPKKITAVILGVLLAFSILGMTGSSEFLYFQF